MNPVNHDRRRFLAAGALLASGAVLAACEQRASHREGNTPSGGASNTPGNTGPAVNNGTQPDTNTLRGTVIGPGKAAVDGRTVFFIGMVNLDTAPLRAATIEDINFFGHGFTPNPRKPHLAVISEKHGKGACEVDLAARRVTRYLKTAEEREFYGHGAYTADGRTLFLAESVVKDRSYAGVVAVYDGESFEPKGTFRSYGLAPHDMILVDDGATLVITNGGGPEGSGDAPCITFVDVKTQELKQRLVFPNARVNAGHIAITSRGEIACVSAPREGMDSGAPDFLGNITFYDPADGKMRTSEHEIVKKMKAETLSVAIHEPTMTVGATTPAGNLVTFWEFKTGRLIKAFDGDFKKPRGISVTLDGRYFVLTHDEKTNLILIDAQTLEPVSELKVETSYMAGSHNYVYRL